MCVFLEFTIILLLSYTHRRPIGDPSETSVCFIGDLDMLHQRPKCMTGDPSDLDMLHGRPACLIGDPSMTSTCFLGDWHAWSQTHQRPRLATLENNMPDWRPIKDRHAPSVTDISHQKLTCLIGYPSETSTCFSYLASRSPMGLREVSDVSPIIIIFSWTRFISNKQSIYLRLRLIFSILRYFFIADFKNTTIKCMLKSKQINLFLTRKTCILKDSITTVWILGLIWQECSVLNYYNDEIVRHLIIWLIDIVEYKFIIKSEVPNIPEKI